MITLTVPKQTNDDGETIPGGTFAFVRGLEGEHSLEGNWQTVTTVGSLPPGVIVHIDLQKALTEIAKSRGLDDGYGFARNIPKPVKQEKVKSSSEPSARRTRKNPELMGGFNPWAKSN